MAKQLYIILFNIKYDYLLSLFAVSFAVSRLNVILINSDTLICRSEAIFLSASYSLSFNEITLCLRRFSAPTVIGAPAPFRRPPQLLSFAII
nr:MAG TPA: hypothetical protein [Caudoviricetes sp.]